MVIRRILRSSSCAGWFYVSLTQATVVLEDRTSIEKKPPAD